MDDAARRQALLDGSAWRAFCRALEEAGSEVLAADVPATDVDRAEGFRYLTRLTRLAFKLALEHGDPAAPQLVPYMGETQKFGIDNPDQDYLWARIGGGHRYRLAGTRGSVGYLGIGIYAGSAGRGGRRTVAHLHGEDLRVDAEGRFELLLGPEPGPEGAHFVALPEDTTTLIVRQTFGDRTREAPAQLTLACLDREGPPPPVDPARVAKALDRAASQIRGSLTMFKQLAARWAEQPNVLHPTDRKMAEQSFGDPDLVYCGGYWRVAPGEALVLDFTPPPCRWWGFVLCNVWAESLEFRYRPVCVNGVNARRRADGSVRLIVAHEDPGLPDANWIDPEGHREGTLCLRWLLVEGEAPLPQPRLVDAASLAGGGS